MQTRTGEIGRERGIDLLIVVLALGSLWGLSEVVLGGAIREAGLPYRAGILTGVGMGLMGVAAGGFRRPLMLVGIALVAILCKLLALPILHVSIMCKANSCLAVVLEGLALAGVISLAGRKMQRGVLTKAASGASAALLAATSFYFIGMRLAPCRYLLSFARPGGFVAFLGAEGAVWAVFSAVLFPVGCWIGARLKDTVPAPGMKRPLPYYVASAALVICCWTASAVAIVAGL